MKTAARAMSSGWPMRPSGVARLHHLAEITFGHAGAMQAFGFHHAGVEGIDANFARAEFAGEGHGDGVDRGFGRAVDGARGQGHRAHDGADVDNGTTIGADVLDGFFRGEQQAEHIEVELLVEVLGGDGFERREFVNASVID